MSFSVIATTDIRDVLVKPIIAQADIDLAHKHLVYLAQAVGVAEADMLTSTAAHYLVREFAIEYATMIRAQLRAGLDLEQLQVAQGITVDPFQKKYDTQRKIVADLEERLNAGVFTGDAEAPGDFAIGAELYRA